jgi:hypothetical protein
MPDPVSIGALYIGYAVLAGYARSTSAVSAEAKEICKAAHAVMSDRESSEALFGQKAFALSKLRTAVADVIPDDEQEAVDAQAYWNAEQFLLALPDDLPTPEFGIDPDGAISLDWMPSRTRMFSVSISASERLAYAWLDGSDKGHGVARFRAPAVPTAVLSFLQALVADGSANLRAA